MDEKKYISEHQMEHLTIERLHNLWDYYLLIENDMAQTSQYVEPVGQEKVYSLEFAKIIVLVCTEVDSVMNQICYELSGETQGEIKEYKGIILEYIPKIVTAKVTIPRWNKTIRPFSRWNKGPLAWWKTYTDVKHWRSIEFKQANYKNAVVTLSALYLLILYLADICGYSVDTDKSQYISCEYIRQNFFVAPPIMLPGMVEYHKIHG